MASIAVTGKPMAQKMSRVFGTFQQVDWSHGAMACTSQSRSYMRGTQQMSMECVDPMAQRIAGCRTEFTLAESARLMLVTHRPLLARAPRTGKFPAIRSGRKVWKTFEPENEVAPGRFLCGHCKKHSGCKDPLQSM